MQSEHVKYRRDLVLVKGSAVAFLLNIIKENYTEEITTIQNLLY